MTRIDGVVYVNGHPTKEIIPETHIRRATEMGIQEEVVAWLGKLDDMESSSYTEITGVPSEEYLETTYTIASDYEVKNYTFPPTCYYLGDEDREAAGQLLGKWMAYTEDVYDELIGLGVEPKDLVYMVRWKRD